MVSASIYNQESRRQNRQNGEHDPQSNMYFRIISFRLPLDLEHDRNIPIELLDDGLPHSYGVILHVVLQPSSALVHPL